MGNRPASFSITAALRDDILSGTVAPGEWLRQDILAARFGTSRIPVREALRQLAAESLVVHDTHRGTRVAPLTLVETLERMDIRVALEVSALRFAVPAMSELDFETLDGILEDYDRGDCPERWAAANWEFHTALYAPAGRPTLLALIQANYANVDRFLRLRLSRATGKDDPQREHRELLAACRAGDVARASALLEQHITRARKALAAAIRMQQR
jgi:DNA-binding GntR family transcriptional regulator